MHRCYQNKLSNTLLVLKTSSKIFLCDCFANFIKSCNLGLTETRKRVDAAASRKTSLSDRLANVIDQLQLTDDGKWGTSDTVVK